MTFKVSLNPKTTIALLECAVAIKGADYIYDERVPSRFPDRDSECVYARNGLPSCIVGYVIVLAGGDLSAVTERSSVVHALMEAGVQFDDQSISALIMAQVNQDNGHSWGDALDAAKATLP